MVDVIVRYDNQREQVVDVAHKYIDIHWSRWCASKALKALKRLCICDGTVTLYLFLTKQEVQNNI